MLRRSPGLLCMFSLTLLLSAVGCAAHLPEEEGESGAAETVRSVANAKIVEVSRFRREGRLSGFNDGGSVGAYRVNGFGSTKVRVEVKAKDGAFAPLVAIAGPVPGEEATIVRSKRGTRAAGAVIETTLDARGAYRILVGTEASFDGRAGDAGAFDVSFTCLTHCDAPEVSLAEVVADLKATVGDATLRQTLEDVVASRALDAEARAQLVSSVEALIADPNGIDERGLPALPLSLAAIAQGIAGATAEPTPERPEGPPGALSVELANIGESCRPHRSDPAAARELLPGLSETELPDYSYDDCALAKMQGLAEAFNALSLQNGSEVLDGPHRYTTVGELAGALVASGHHVVLDNARYFADFLGLSYKGASVRAPVWIDTGIPLTGGGTLRMPAPHAHHNIWISGPKFDGQLKFYMGVDSGTAFRAQGTLTRAWSGGRVAYTIDSATEADDVIRVLAVAGNLRKKWQEAGASLPLQGYGRLGVCTDSTAVLEYAYRGSASLYPLAHPMTGANADAIDRILAELPADLASAPDADAVRRLAATIPFDDVAAVPFPAFRIAWAKVER